MKIKLTLIVFLTSFSQLYTQELLCNIRVNSAQVQTSDRKVFNTMQTAIYEFVNNTKWTSTNIHNEERIECTIMINIRKKISN